MEWEGKEVWVEEGCRDGRGKRRVSRGDSQQTAAKRVGEIGLFPRELFFLCQSEIQPSLSCGSLGASDDFLATRIWAEVEGYEGAHES